MPLLHRYTGQSPATVSKTVHPAVVEAHAGDAAFLWMQRARAVSQANYTLVDLARLDQRVEAHLEGLQVAGIAGWEALTAALDGARPQDVFPAVVWALRAGDIGRLDVALTATGDDPALWNVAVSACGWALESDATHLHRLLESDSPALRYIAIGACAVRGAAPGKEVLERMLDKEPDAAVKARATRMIGELGLSSYAARLNVLVEDAEPPVRRAAAWSLGVFQSHARSFPLLISAARDQPAIAEAYELAARRLEAGQARELVDQLLQEGRQRQALRVAGAAGLPSCLDVVLKLMAVEELARLAGLVFSQITGADLVKLKLEREDAAAPAPDPKQEAEQGDEELDEEAQRALELEEERVDSEAYLPIPDPGRVSAWWRTQEPQYALRTRYLAGRAIDEASVKKTLLDGTQAQRRAAAIELSLLVRGTPIYNTSQPGFVQARALLGWT